jgi:hypothetical protein
MTSRNFTERYRMWITMLMLAVGLLIVIATGICIISFLFPSASAEVFVYGSQHNYSVNVIPNNSYVHQGDNISQGCYYDLTGVYGWSGYLGTWNHEGDVGYIMPDHYISFNSGPAPRHYYIDPEKMPTGDWYQIDKFSFADDSDDTTIESPSFGSENALAFHLVGSQFATSDTGELLVSPVQTTIATYYSNITRYDGTTIEHIPVSMTAVETVTPESSFVPAGDVVVITVNPTTANASGVKETPTPKEAPGFLLATMIALAVVIVYRRN